LLLTGSICDSDLDVIVEISISNARQRQNFTDENLALHVTMVVNARCWAL